MSAKDRVVSLVVGLLLAAHYSAEPAGKYSVSAIDTPEPWKSSADFVSLGDGNDAPLVQAALAACRGDSAPGCWIDLLPGTFVIPDTVVLQHHDDGTAIMGSGVGSTVIDCSGGEGIDGVFEIGSNVIFSTLGDLEIGLMTIDCMGRAPGLGFFNAIIQKTSGGEVDGVYLHDLKIKSDADDLSGVMFSGQEGLRNFYADRLDVEVRGNYGVNIRPNGECSNINIRNSRFVMPDYGAETANNIGVYGGCSGVEVSGNFVDGGTQWTHSPIACSPCSDAVISNNVVTGSLRSVGGTPAGECAIEAEWKGGHGGSLTDETHGISITGNIVNGGNAGICILTRTAPTPDGPPPREIYIGGNTIRNTGKAIWIVDATDVAIGPNAYFGNAANLVTEGTVTLVPSTP